MNRQMYADLGRETRTASGEALIRVDLHLTSGILPRCLLYSSICIPSQTKQQSLVHVALFLHKIPLILVWFSRIRLLLRTHILLTSLLALFLTARLVWIALLIVEGHEQVAIILR